MNWVLLSNSADRVSAHFLPQPVRRAKKIQTLRVIRYFKVSNTERILDLGSMRTGKNRRDFAESYFFIWRSRNVTWFPGESELLESSAPVTACR